MGKVNTLRFSSKIRFYETMGTDTDMIHDYAKAYVSSLQEIEGDYLNGALASTKHFLGDGATYNGNG